MTCHALIAMEIESWASSQKEQVKPSDCTGFKYEWPRCLPKQQDQVRARSTLNKHNALTQAAGRSRRAGWNCVRWNFAWRYASPCVRSLSILRGRDVLRYRRTCQRESTNETKAKPILRQMCLWPGENNKQISLNHARRKFVCPKIATFPQS